jgi:hypothetical protein
MSFTPATQLPLKALGMMGRFQTLTTEQEALKAEFLRLPDQIQRLMIRDAHSGGLDYITGKDVIAMRGVKIGGYYELRDGDADSDTTA